MEAVNSSYLGCAEPSWATAVPEPQLRGILTMASLMSETVYLSDVHLGDNDNFVRSFMRRRQLGLYTQMRELTKQGVVRLLLRDASVRPAVDSTFQVNSFMDVYRSWLAQDQDSAWIVPPGGEERQAFLQDIDSWVPSAAIERYSYLQTKEVFIETVRAVAESRVGSRWLGFDDPETSRELRSRYDRLIERDWFSLSDFYSLFQTAGLTPASTPMLLHGLLNEVAYSRSAGSSLVGSDLHGVPLEDVFWPAQRDQSSSIPVRTATPVEAILEHAQKVMQAPDLSIVGLLKPGEVLELRESVGQPYFDLLNLALDNAYLSQQERFDERLAAAAADYWQGVAEYLARRHPGATRRPRKLAIFLGRLPAGVGQGARNLFSFAVNVGLPAAGDLGVPGTGLAALLAKGMGGTLRFLFVAETEELQRIRRVIPNRTWLTRSNALVMPEIEE